LALNPLNRRMGLLGMKERIAFLGGEMDLESQLKKGTKIKIEIPWSRESHVSKDKGSYS
jgi:signal transduction histidine kinase